MRTLYEGSVYDIMKYGGVARYFTELMNRLPNEFVPAVLGPPDQPEGLTHPNLVYEPIQTRAPIKLFRHAWRRLQHRRMDQWTEQFSPDLIHWTYFNGLCKRPIGRSNAPTVITVYDFIHEDFPESDPGGKHHRIKERAIGLADRICCISKATHDELCRRYPGAASRATVTQLGIGFQQVTADPLPDELRNRPYILFVGRRDSYKNFGALWRAWQNAKSKLGEAALVVTGPALNDAERDELDWPAKTNDEFVYEYVSDGLLKSLYQNCAAFVFPSRLEGFGLPILESLSNGGQVIASDIPVFRELADTAAHYFDPEDVDSLADLLILATNENLPDREQKMELGKRRVEIFSWDNTVQKTLDVYRTLADGKQNRAA